MSSQKSISKSIRLTEEVFAYIDNYKGEGFNQKFENIILDAMCAEKHLKKRLKLLDKQMTEKQEQLKEHLSDIQTFTDIQRSAVWMLRDIARAQERVSQMYLCRPGQLPPDEIRKEDANE